MAGVQNDFEKGEARVLTPSAHTPMAQNLVTWPYPAAKEAGKWFFPEPLCSQSQIWGSTKTEGGNED